MTQRVKAASRGRRSAIRGEAPSDLLVIGTGIAGLVAALEAGRAGLDVTLLSKMDDPAESNTYYAQGGIAVRGLDDPPGLFARDILAAGAGSSSPDAAGVLTSEGPAKVAELLIGLAGVEFDQTEDGEINLTAEAAHSRRRIYHHQDATGKEIELKLLAAVRRLPNVRLLSGQVAIDLITSAHHSTDPLAVYAPNECLGAYVFDTASSRVVTRLAANTVLASGGIGRIYLHTTNPSTATGDGVAMARRAGASVINAEYVQFHPTALFHRDAGRFLISEAVRGEGGRLVSAKGEAFMKRYAPRLKDLAPRDVVARAIHEEMARTGEPCVFLDIAGSAPRGLDIAGRFPTIHATCLKYGIDITREPIPVVPAAHYFCGGVKVDPFGQTELPNLYAVGEVACTGLHGANRLASTSLLEGVVWGSRAVRKILEHGPRELPASARTIPPWRDEGLVEEEDPVLITQDLLTVQTTMWNYAGIVRTEKRLRRAADDIGYLYRRVMSFYRSTKLTRQLIELRNAVLTAQIVIDAALRNPQSRGCHFRKA
ncbi:MAG: L-aspartate oxidase [Candidatus Wallbacteria bacterium]|nr:L-aspartate oxidase [Candidatus Wallbacteria bacterium]